MMGKKKERKKDRGYLTSVVLSITTEVDDDYMLPGLQAVGFHPPGPVPPLGSFRAHSMFWSQAILARPKATGEAIFYYVLLLTY